MPATANSRTTHLGVISADAAYPLSLFMQLTGMSRFAMRSARKRGLFVRRSGGRAYVKGSDFLTYLDRLDAAEDGNQDGTSDGL